MESRDDVKQLNEFEMWLTKFGEKLNVLRWIVGGERKFDRGWVAWAFEIVDKLLQSNPLSRRIGEWTSNWNKNELSNEVDLKLISSFTENPSQLLTVTSLKNFSSNAERRVYWIDCPIDWSFFILLQVKVHHPKDEGI